MNHRAYQLFEAHLGGYVPEYFSDVDFMGVTVLFDTGREMRITPEHLDAYDPQSGQSSVRVLAGIIGDSRMLDPLVESLRDWFDWLGVMRADAIKQITSLGYTGVGSLIDWYCVEHAIEHYWKGDWFPLLDFATGAWPELEDGLSTTANGSSVCYHPGCAYRSVIQ